MAGDKGKNEVAVLTGLHRIVFSAPAHLQIWKPSGKVSGGFFIGAYDTIAADDELRGGNIFPTGERGKEKTASWQWEEAMDGKSHRV